MHNLQAFSSLLHLFGLALWLGGSGFFLVAFAPAVRDLNPSAGIQALNQGRIALERTSWIGIGLLMVTGAVNLTLRNQATGADLGQAYMIVFAVKLLLFVAMLAHHSLQVFKYGPQIAQLTASENGHAAAWSKPLQAQWKKWFLMLKINATLGPIAVLLGVLLKHN